VRLINHHVIKGHGGVKEYLHAVFIPAEKKMNSQLYATVLLNLKKNPHYVLKSVVFWAITRRRVVIIITTRRRVITQKTTDFINIAAEA
jgi:hypothetical protein